MAYLSAFPRAVITPESAALKRVVEKTIIGTYAPAAPLIGPGSKSASIGSCFAAEISNVLQRHHLDTVQLDMAETSNSAFALDLYFARLIEGKPLPAHFVGDVKLENSVTSDMVAKFMNADIYILTFGMSLCWFNDAGEFVTQPPKVSENLPSTSIIKADANYYMRQTTIEENEAAIQRCIDKIRAKRPTTPIVMTLSPIPLAGTRYDIPAVPANAISKAVLRAAIENVRRRQAENVYYWPSYEIVTWFGCHVERSFGEDGKDSRHVREQVFKLIGELFVDIYVAKTPVI